MTYEEVTLVWKSASGSNLLIVIRWPPHIRLRNRVGSETIIRKFFIRISKHYITSSKNTNNHYTKITLWSTVKSLKHIIFIIVHQNRTWCSQPNSLLQLLNFYRKFTGLLLTPRTNDGLPNEITVLGRKKTWLFIFIKKIYNYWQWLDRFKQYTKRKYEIDIESLIKEETMTGTEWNNKEATIQQDFLWALGPEETHQITRSEYRTDPDNIKIEKLIKTYNRHYLPEGNKYNSRGEFFWAKQTDTETPEDHWEKLVELEKQCVFRDFSTEFHIMKIITSVTDTKIREKLLKEDLEEPKVVDQIQQNTYDRKNKKNTIPENQISNRERDIKEEPIHRITLTGQYGTKPKEKSKDRNGRYCDAPNWNPNHKCPARE